MYFNALYWKIYIAQLCSVITDLVTNIGVGETKYGKNFNDVCPYV